MICAHAYAFNVGLLYFGTGHVTAMAQAPGTLLITPAGCHLRAVIFRGNSGFGGLNSKDTFWFERQDSISHGCAVTRICLSSPFPFVLCLCSSLLPATWWKPVPVKEKTGTTKLRNTMEGGGTGKKSEEGKLTEWVLHHKIIFLIRLLVASFCRCSISVSLLRDPSI